MSGTLRLSSGWLKSSPKVSLKRLPGRTFQVSAAWLKHNPKVKLSRLGHRTPSKDWLKSCPNVKCNSPGVRSTKGWLKSSPNVRLLRDGSCTFSSVWLNRSFHSCGNLTCSKLWLKYIPKIKDSRLSGRVTFSWPPWPAVAHGWFQPIPRPKGRGGEIHHLRPTI